MSEKFNAIVAELNDEGKPRANLKQITLDEVPDEDVLIDVAFSTVNYKDGLAVTGKGKICRKFPMVCGIDLSGTVIESRNDKWQAGDEVLVNGYGLSEDHWGGYAQKQKVKSEFLVKVPDAFNLEQVMALGTAGYTAMLCVNAVEDHGTKPADGPVLVTGAAGGVGSVAVMALSKLGYEVHASTGRPETESYLKSLGAAEIVARDELARDAKPLERELWAGVVDCVGDKTLATAIAQTKHEGIVAPCGLAGGFGLPATVMPLILRGVTVRGVESIMTSMARRERAWESLATLIDQSLLDSVYRVEPLGAVPELANTILAGKIQGRVVIDVNA
ncbi:MAG: MDR family oxidoreductase [Gammaproteobacteria bacterium]